MFYVDDVVAELRFDPDVVGQGHCVQVAISLIEPAVQADMQRGCQYIRAAEQQNA